MDLAAMSEPTMVTMTLTELLEIKRVAFEAGREAPSAGERVVALTEPLEREEAIRYESTMKEHQSHVAFENELYATLVDPVAEGPIKEADMRKQLLESARWYRQRVYDLEQAALAIPSAAQGLCPACHEPAHIMGTPCPADWRCDYCGHELCYYENCHECGPTCIECERRITKSEGGKG